MFLVLKDVKHGANGGSHGVILGQTIFEHDEVGFLSWDYRMYPIQILRIIIGEGEEHDAVERTSTNCIYEMKGVVR